MDSTVGQTETGVGVPLIGARQATLLGGLIVGLVTIATAWRVPRLYLFHRDQMEMSTERRTRHRGAS